MTVPHNPHVWKILLTAAIGLAVLCGGYIIYLVADTYAKVKMAPREGMFICPKHGPLRKQHIIRFQVGPTSFVESCPICFHERLGGAEKIR